MALQKATLMLENASSSGESKPIPFDESKVDHIVSIILGALEENGFYPASTPDDEQLLMYAMTRATIRAVV